MISVKQRTDLIAVQANTDDAFLWGKCWTSLLCVCACVCVCVHVCVCTHMCVCTLLLSRVQFLQLHRLQSVRLLCPWDSPGRNTEWVGIPFSRVNKQGDLLMRLILDSGQLATMPSELPQPRLASITTLWKVTKYPESRKCRQLCLHCHRQYKDVKVLLNILIFHIN